MPGTTIVLPTDPGSMPNNPSAFDQASITTPARGTKPTAYWSDDFSGLLGSSYYQYGSPAGGLIQLANTFVPGAGNGGAYISTGGSASGYNNYHYGFYSLASLYSAVRCRFGFWVSSLSVTGTNGYMLCVGSFMGNYAPISGGTTQPLVYLMYTDSLNGGRFALASAAPANMTTAPTNMTDTGVTVAANTYYVLDYTVTINYATASTTLPVSWALYAGGSTQAAASGAANIGAASSTAKMALLAASIGKVSGTTGVNYYMDFNEFIGAY